MKKLKVSTRAIGSVRVFDLEGDPTQETLQDVAWQIQRKIRRHRLQDRRAEFLGFALIGLAGLVATQGLLWLGTVALGLPVLPAKAMSAGGVFMLNFTLRKWLLFTQPPAHTDH